MKQFLNRCKIIWTLLVSYTLCLPLTVLVSIAYAVAFLGNPVRMFLEISDSIGLDCLWDVEAIREAWVR